MTDLMVIIGLTLITCGVIAGVGAAALYALRRHSLRYQLAVVALLPVAAVTATVAINVWLMFLSRHDSTVIVISLITAVPLAALGAWLVVRRISRGSAELSAALGRLVADSTGPTRPTVEQPSDGAGAGGRSTRTGLATASSGDALPAELATVLADLDATRLTLAEARRRQQAAEDARRELVSFMSHDLRTPLAGLRALAEGLEDGVISDVPRALSHLGATVNRMSHLVDDLFELSRVQGERETRPETLVSLSELIIDVTSEAQAVARAHRVQLEVTVPDEDRLAVVGSADDLARAVTNLVANAMRHTEAGGVVRVGASRADDGHVRVEVVDRCGGIPEESLDRVFDIGWRGSEARSADGGAGLGLAIARGVVQAHDGRIEVRNVAGGCRFAVDLPEPAVPALGPAANRSAISGTAASGSGATATGATGPGASGFGSTGSAS
jgi:signal transduction histidine kinase